MHESGVTARPFKGKKKNVVSLTGRPVASRFQDIRDVSRVSLVDTISLGLRSLPPLLLTTSEVAFKSRELIPFCDELLVFRTAKRYMTIDAMRFYINSILGPYMKSFRDQFSDRTLNVYLIADNHGRALTRIFQLCSNRMVLSRSDFRHTTATFCNRWTWRFLDHSKGITEIHEDQS
jgi:hypothetical protein